MKQLARHALFFFLLNLASPGMVNAGDTSDPGGQWHLVNDTDRLEMTIQPDGGGGWSGFMSVDGDVNPIGEIDWQPATRMLQFRRTEAGVWRWYRGRIVEGIFVGRTTLPAVSENLPPIQSFNRHVTGWNSSYLDTDIVPRVFDVVLGEGYLARIRIDRADGGTPGYVGQMKVYATAVNGALDEDLQYDVDVTAWDGTKLQFTRHNGDFWQSYQGVVEGRRITGTFTQLGTPQIFSWFGERAEVLSHGLSRLSDAGLRAWQERTRRQLEHLKMAGAPPPLSTTVNALQRNMPPRPSTQMSPRRDDDPANWPQHYTLNELELLHTLANPYDTGTLTRRGHAYLAVPSGESHTRRPAVLALNGHFGSAWKVMDPDDSLFWYGDSFARRGYIVMALDVSHRAYGDDPTGGNGPHPAIAAPGFDSDWEEDGERVWSAMRAVDYLLSRPDVDPSRLIVAGLSMGGEVASLLAAMDTRVKLAVSSGYSPDFSVMAWNGNHDCWEWNHADIREYLDMSDYYALIAPRPLIAQNGRGDFTFSTLLPPFPSGRQVLRRSSLVSAQRSILTHHLHDGGHVFRVGGTAVDGEPAPGIVVPVIDGPVAPWDLIWQVDHQTRSLGLDLYGLIDRLIETLYADGFENTP